VLECWGIKRRHRTFSQYANTPVLHFPEIDLFLESHDGLPAFGLKIRMIFGCLLPGNRPGCYRDQFTLQYNSSYLYLLEIIELVERQSGR